MMPKLTITASNRDRLQIKNCQRSEWFLKSLQWQTYTDFELLIADGGSKNYEEIKKYFENYNGIIPMRIVQLKIGKPFERARLNNVGIRHALGEYVMTTDVDMLYGNKFVETVMNIINKKTSVLSRTMYLKSNWCKKIYNGEVDPYNDVNSIRKCRIKKRTTAGGSHTSHISNWNKVHGYCEKYKGWGSEDQDLMKRMKKAGIRTKWIGESRDDIMLFHQSHPKIDIKDDLRWQEKNKKFLNNITSYIANPDGFWGGIQD